VSKWDISKPQRGERVVLTQTLQPRRESASNQYSGSFFQPVSIETKLFHP
jgi:hypothetical protein